MNNGNKRHIGKDDWRQGSGIGKGRTHKFTGSGEFCISTPIKTRYFNIPISGRSPWAASDTFGVYELDFSFVLSSVSRHLKWNLIWL